MTAILLILAFAIRSDGKLYGDQEMKKYFFLGDWPRSHVNEV